MEERTGGVVHHQSCRDSTSIDAGALLRHSRNFFRAPYGRPRRSSLAKNTLFGGTGRQVPGGRYQLTAERLNRLDLAQQAGREQSAHESEPWAAFTVIETFQSPFGPAGLRFTY